MEGRVSKVKWTSRRPKREGFERNIRRYLDKENVVPGTPYNLPRKKGTSENSLTSKRVPLNVKDGNGGRSPVGSTIVDFYHKSYKPSSPVNKLKGSLDVEHQGDKQENDKKLQKERSKSVCLICVKPDCQDGTDKGTWGTGFVFVGNIIQTNNHVLGSYLEGNELKENVSVNVVFNFDDPELKENQLCFTAEKILVACDEELDYAFLRLKPGDKEVPPGLVRHIGPKPKSGRISITGHENGGVKKSENSQIIAPGNRMKVVVDSLAQFKDRPLKQMSIWQNLKNQDIEKIISGVDTDKVVTYRSSMFQGTSGSPVFADGNVVAMHTAGYGYEFENEQTYVMSKAVDQLIITESLVCKLKESGNVPILESLKLAAKDNPHLSQILDVEPMEIN